MAPKPSQRRAPRARKGVKPKAPSADNRRGALTGADELVQIRRLIRLVQRTGIGELEISSGDRSVRISAFGVESAGRAAMSPARSTGAPAEAPAAPGPASVASTTIAITSPMVGTFYRAPAPEADPYIEAGDR